MGERKKEAEKLGAVGIRLVLLYVEGGEGEGARLLRGSRVGTYKTPSYNP